MSKVIEMPKANTVDGKITRSVRTLMAYYDRDRGDVCRALGVSRATYYNRMNGDAPWTAVEVVQLAEFFHVPITVIFEGPRLPRLDSNQESSDLQFRPTSLAHWRERKTS
jgi:hypothetical protein